MMTLKLYEAQVIDDNDPDTKGRVKIRVLPEMIDVKDSLLPWALPHGWQGTMASSFTHDAPAIGSLVWAYFRDEYWQEPYYFSGRHLKGVFNFTTIQNLLSSITEVGAITYPNPRFVLYDDGTAIFRNSETGAIGVVSSNGGHFVIGENGVVSIGGSEIHLKGDAKHFVRWEDLDTYLKNTLKTWADTHVHSDPVSGTTGTPTSALTVNIDGAKTTNILTE